MLTPKERFQQLAAERKFHEDLVTNPGFIRALDYALLQMLAEENPTMTDQTAARFSGAKRFCDILLNLAEVPNLPIHDRSRENLNHKI